jgi:HK97 family phage major capsid protein
LGKLKELQEKRKRLLAQIDSATTNEQLDKIELDMRKIAMEIEQEKRANSYIDENGQSLRTRIVNADDEDDNFNDTQSKSADYIPGVGFRAVGSSIIDNKFYSGNSTASESISVRKSETFKRKLNIENRGLNIGKYIRGIATGNWENAENEKRAMTTAGTGTLIPQELSADIIDMARAVSLFTSADVPVIPMKSNNVTISRVKKDPVFSFKQEAKSGVSAEFELEPVELKSKTCYGYAYVSLEAIKSSKNLDFIIYDVFSKAIANSIDKAMLYGQYNTSTTSYDDFAPAGIMNDEGIKKLVAVEGQGYDTFIKAISKVRKENGNPTSYCINSDTEELLSLLKTSDGQYLNPPQAIEKLNKVVSNQLNSDEESGSDALVFDPLSMIIGIQNEIQIQMFDNTDECIKNGLVGFRVYAMIDCVATQPNHICKIEGIK